VSNDDRIQPAQAAADPSATAGAAPSPWAPFRRRAFAILWLAAVVSNIGTWMYNAASGWLMTSLDPEPLTVSLVQAANTLPMFLFAVPAGALADIFDKRRFLIIAEIATTALCALYAAIVGLGLETPGNLLLFTFLIAAAGALTAPAWQSIVPQLVAKEDLSAAVSANSVGVNVSRAIGPALGGAAIIALGIAAPFWFNAVSNLAIVAALLWWRAPQRPAAHLPAERFGSAVRVGFRHAGNNLHLRATLIRAAGFFLFGSAYWALLPLVARVQIAGGPELYGILLGVIGAGAVGGAFALPRLKSKLGPDRLMAAASLGTALALVLFGLAAQPVTALAASIVAGLSWIAALATLNVSAQVALPDWVRGRGLAIYVTVFFGAMALGSAAWGAIGRLLGLPLAHLIAAAGLLAIMPLTRRWKLQTGAKINLAPSLHWPAPITARDLEGDRGPVLVTVEYRIDPRRRTEFVAVVAKLAHGRRRDGAYGWGLFEDTAEEGRFVETFLVESWLEHLRQHERVTKADRLHEDKVRAFQLSGEPHVTHFIAAGE
jgi:MFS family permease